MRDTCVLIPTFNEQETIGPLVKELCDRQFRVYLVDDSDDDTWAKALVKGAWGCFCGKGQGLGPSLVKGLETLVQDYQYKYIIVMDAGGTHSPNFVHSLRRTLDQGYTVSIASRFKFSCLFRDRGVRVLVSRVASLLFRWAIGTSIQDATTSFRCYRVDALRTVLPLCKAKGHGIQMEILGHLLAQGGTCYETDGHPYLLSNSTFRWSMVWEAFGVLRRIRRAGRERADRKTG